MAQIPVFIGDELTGLGFRLAGLEVHHEANRFEAALAGAPLVIVTAEIAAELPPGLLGRARRAARPPVAVIADVRGRHRAPDPAHQVRRTLGVADEGA